MNPFIISRLIYLNREPERQSSKELDIQKKIKNNDLVATGAEGFDFKKFEDQLNADVESGEKNEEYERLINKVDIDKKMLEIFNHTDRDDLIRIHVLGRELKNWQIRQMMMEVDKRMTEITLINERLSKTGPEALVLLMTQEQDPKLKNYLDEQNKLAEEKHLAQMMEPISIPTQKIPYLNLPKKYRKYKKSNVLER